MILLFLKMWALNLAIKASIDVDKYETYCGASSDAKYVANTYYENDQNYGYSMYNYYAFLYEISATGITKKKVFIQSSADSLFYSCFIQDTNPSEVILYIYSTYLGSLTIARINTPIEENEFSVQHELHKGLLSVKMGKSSNAEPLLFFSDHIQSIDESKRIDFNFSIFSNTDIYFEQDQNGTEEIYMISSSYYQIIGARLNFIGKEQYVQIISLQLYNDTSINSFVSSYNQDFFILEFQFETAYVDGYYSDPVKIYLDKKFERTQANFSLKENQYTFLKFSVIPDRLFVYYTYSNPEVCYCSYKFDGYSISIDQTLGCYSVGISTLNSLIEVKAQDEDLVKYFIIDKNVLDPIRVDGDPEMINDLELFFPNDAYELDEYQLKKENIKLLSSEGYLVEVRKYQSSNGNIYLHDIVVEEPIKVIHPGVIAGFVIAGLLVLALIGVGIYFCSRWIAKYRLSQAHQSSTYGSHQNNTHQMLQVDKKRKMSIQFNRPNHQSTTLGNNENTSQMVQIERKKQMNPYFNQANRVNVINYKHAHDKDQDKKAKDQVYEMAKRYGTQESCCICLAKGCDSYLPCMHFFHYKCITNWFNMKSELQCPLCQRVTSQKDIAMI